MGYVYLALCALITPTQNVLKKTYSKHCQRGAYVFSVYQTAAASLFFALMALLGGGYAFEWGALPYSVAFGVGYAICTLSATVAIFVGSMALTALMVSYSLMIPTVYGFLFWGEPFTWLVAIGLSLLAVSLFLVNAPVKKKTDGAEHVRSLFSVKWLILAVLALVCNGALSVIQKEQQIRFDGAYKNEFMLISMLIACMCLSLIMLKDRGAIRDCFRVGLVMGGSCGVLNAAMNLMVMLAIALLPATVFYPVLSGAGTVFSYLIAMIFYKERFTMRQHLGILCGVASLIVLNL